MASIGSGAAGSALAVPAMPNSSAADEPTAMAALANSLRFGDMVLPRLDGGWLSSGGHGRALRTPAGTRPTAAGAAAAGAATAGAASGAAAARGARGAAAVSGAVAAAAGAVAAGAVRPGRESPLGSNWARPAVLESGAGSAEVSDESALAGAAAGAGGGRGCRGGGRSRGGRQCGHLGQGQRRGGARGRRCRSCGRGGGAGHGRREGLHQLRRGGPHGAQRAEQLGAGIHWRGRGHRVGGGRPAERKR